MGRDAVSAFLLVGETCYLPTASALRKGQVETRTEVQSRDVRGPTFRSGIDLANLRSLIATAAADVMRVCTSDYWLT